MTRKSTAPPLFLESFRKYRISIWRAPQRLFCSVFAVIPSGVLTFFLFCGLLVARLLRQERTESSRLASRFHFLREGGPLLWCFRPRLLWSSGRVYELRVGKKLFGVAGRARVRTRNSDVWPSMTAGLKFVAMDLDKLVAHDTLVAALARKVWSSCTLSF